MDESDKCQKERERRRKKYKFALVLWDEDLAGGLSRYEVTHKEVLTKWWRQSHEVICDWEPERVLRGMLKLLEEPK
jgi:hypothetical protein